MAGLYGFFLEHIDFDLRYVLWGIYYSSTI